jgi:hypothetical protein
LGSSCKISKDRGKIYFDIAVESLAQVWMKQCFKKSSKLVI